MNSKRQFVLGLLVLLLAFQLACHKKQGAKLKLPGPAEAPTLTQTLPDAIQPEPVPEKPAQAASEEEPPPLPKKNKTHKKASPSGNAQAKTNPPATAAQPSQAPPPAAAEMHPPTPPNAAAEVAIGPDISSAEAARDRQSTTHLLDTTENELKRVDSNNLSSDQQAMLTQIKTFISQSRKAITEGDYERASNLAKKAQLLTDELMKK